MTKAGFIALVGKPNVGKSTLLNQILGEKIAITSPKVQTTRYQITGILTEENNQFIFIDTPGMHKPYHNLGRMMDKSAIDVMHDSEIILWVVDRKYHQSDEMILKRITETKKPTILVINKIDELTHKSHIDEIIISYIKEYDFDEVIPISASLKTNLTHLLKAISNHLPKSPFLYPTDQITNQSDSLRMGELIREKVLYHTTEEIPHSVAVLIEKTEINEETNTLDVDALIVVERASQKAILIGKDGAMLKKIGKEARKDINKIFDLKVHLTLWVKVKKNWRNDPQRYLG